MTDNGLRARRPVTSVLSSVSCAAFLRGHIRVLTRGFRLSIVKEMLTGLRRLKREGPAHEVAQAQFLPYNL